ncbi:MAG: hypothetical protein GX205_01935 [Firmicutes bacterium]|nr:hypothetical protein [Bacillota bacterium]
MKKAFCRLAGVPSGWFERLNLDEIQRQAEDFERLVEADSVHRLYRFLGQMWNTHPWIIIRITNLIQWVEEGSYERILRKRRLVAVNSSGAICECGEVIQEDLYYCLFCGRRVARRHETEVK